MRAAVTEAFGGIDRVVVRDRPKPVPGTGEVRVRVRAASMNPGAGGGIGTFAIQIAKARGARVTAGASERNPGLLREGTLRPVVGEVFGLDAIREAHLRMQSGHARGKIVVRP